MDGWSSEITSGSERAAPHRSGWWSPSRGYGLWLNGTSWAVSESRFPP